MDAHAGQAGGHLLREPLLLLLPLVLLLEHALRFAAVANAEAVASALVCCLAGCPPLRLPRQLCSCASTPLGPCLQVGGGASEEESESDGWGDDSDSDAEEEGGEGGASKEEGEGGGGDGNTTGGEGGGGAKKEGGKKKERGAGGDYDYFDDFIDDEGEIGGHWLWLQCLLPPTAFATLRALAPCCRVGLLLL